MLDSVFSAVFNRHVMHAAITSSLSKLMLLLLPLLLLTESSPSASYKAEITRRLVGLTADAVRPCRHRITRCFRCLATHYGGRLCNVTEPGDR